MDVVQACTRALLGYNGRLRWFSAGNKAHQQKLQSVQQDEENAGNQELKLCSTKSAGDRVNEADAYRFS